MSSISYALLVIYKSDDSFYVQRNLIVQSADYEKMVELKKSLEQLNKRDNLSYKLEEVYQFKECD